MSIVPNALRLLLLLLLASSAMAEKKNFTYAGANGKEHDMEVYFPEGHSPTDKAPCFIFFHGGGWVGGDLAQGRPFCEYLASRGMVAITANYSMHSKEALEALPAEESKKRICVMDGKTVVRWVKSHAGELGVDPGKIAAGGASAGGHISVLQMMDEAFNNPADPEGFTTEVQALVLLCPAFTILDADEAPDVNVFKYVKKHFPPTLFIVGENDRWKQASDELMKQLRVEGAELEGWVGRGGGHMFFREKGWLTPSLLAIDAFLAKHGLLPGEPRLTPAAEDKTLEHLD